MFKHETTTSPQGSRIAKNIGHPTSGSGGKKTFKRYLKSEHTDGQTHRRTNTQTDKHTDGQTHRRTFRLIESIGPEGRCFENHWIFDHGQTFPPPLGYFLPCSKPICVPPADVDNPGYFPPILGLFWAVLDYLRLIPGYLPPIHHHIVIHCRCLASRKPQNIFSFHF